MTAGVVVDAPIKVGVRFYRAARPASSCAGKTHHAEAVLRARLLCYAERFVSEAPGHRMCRAVSANSTQARTPAGRPAWTSVPPARPVTAPHPSAPGLGPRLRPRLRPVAGGERVPGVPAAPRPRAPRSAQPSTLSARSGLLRRPVPV